MAKAPDPDWFKNLHSSDRAVARGWVKAHGEARVLRIALAAGAAKRPRHRPPVEYGPQLDRAFLLWLLNSELDEIGAARLTAKAVWAEEDWQGLPSLPSEVALRNRLRDGLREKVSNLTLGDLSGPVEAAHVRGETTRFDEMLRVFQAAIPNSRSLLPRLHLISPDMGKVSGMIRAASAMTAPPLTVFRIGEAMGRMMAGIDQPLSPIKRMAEIARRAAALGEALGIPVPPETPISKLTAILNDLAAGLREHLRAGHDEAT